MVESNRHDADGASKGVQQNRPDEPDDAYAADATPVQEDATPVQADATPARADATPVQADATSAGTPMRVCST